MMNGVKINMELSANAVNFIDDAKLQSLLKETKEDLHRAREIFRKALDKNPLTVEETAILLAIESQEGLQELFEAARELKGKFTETGLYFLPPYMLETIA